MKDLFYLVVGGDKRQELIFSALKSNGKKAELIFKSYNDNICYDTDKISLADVIILPTPLTKDGENIFSIEEKKLKISELLKYAPENSLIFSGGELPKLNEHKILKTFNLLKDEELTLKNAVATSEAALKILIEETDRTIFGAKIFVIGFGRIGKITADYLKALKGDITVVARRPEVIAEAEIKGFKAMDFKTLKANISTADIIVNTVPSPVITADILRLLRPATIILDLASMPGGLDFKAAEKLNIKAIHALSLPGKYSPLSAAEYILTSVKKTVNSIFKE